MEAVAKRKTSYLYLEYLRVISAVAVIVIHVSGANWFSLDIGSSNWIVQTFFNIGGRFSTCVFAMISGALLLRPDKDISTHDLVFRYIKRILICYVAWIVLYALFYTVLNHEGVEYFITRLFSLPDHLWYLLMLMGFYVSYPAARLITRNRTVTLYLIWVFIAMGTLTLVTGTTDFFSEMAGEDFGFGLWTSFLGNFGELKIPFSGGYFGFFLLGHYIHEYGLGAWHKRIVIAAIPALLLSALLTVMISTMTGKYVYTFMLETNPLVALGAAGIFAFFRGEDKVVQREEPRPGMSKAMVWVASYTFGIYLVHFAIRDLLGIGFGFDVASYPAILSVPGNTLLIFAASLAITVVLKKIPVVNKILS